MIWPESQSNTIFPREVSLGPCLSLLPFDHLTLFLSRLKYQQCCSAFGFGSNRSSEDVQAIDLAIAQQAGGTSRISNRHSSGP